MPSHGTVVLKLIGGTKISDVTNHYDEKYDTLYYGAVREFIVKYSIFILFFIILAFQYFSKCINNFNLEEIFHSKNSIRIGEP